MIPRTGIVDNAGGGVDGWRITPNPDNVIDYVTISTRGNATDFGDLIATTIIFMAGNVASSH